MRIINTLLTGLTTLVLCGCATGPTFAPMGRDEFMVEHQGGAYSSASALKILCLRDANKYCIEHGLVMVPVSTSGKDGQIEAWGSIRGNCELVFLAVPANDPRNKTPNMERSPDSVNVIKQEIKTVP